MFKIIKYLRSGLVVSAITAMSMGLSAGSVFAQEEEDEKEKEASSREVLVECDKGQSVTQTLVQFANDTKLLEITIRGECLNEPEGIVQIERNNVELRGDGGIIPFLLVDGGRQIVIEGNLTLDGGLAVGNGLLEIEAEGLVTINGAVQVTLQSMMLIAIEAPDDDDDESLNGTDAGKVEIHGPVSVENQSGLGAVSFVNGGYITFNDDINLSLQSSLNLRDAKVQNIDLSYDSHALLGDNVTGNSITCDRESRVWGNTAGINYVSADPDNSSCQGD